MRTLLLWIVVAACSKGGDATRELANEPVVPNASTHSSRPGWREPRRRGPAGPPVVWTQDRGDAGAQMLWTPEHALLTYNESGVSLVREGKVAWHVPVTARDVVLVGCYAVVRTGGAYTGLYVIELATGTATKVFGGHPSAIGAAGRKLMVQVGPEVFELVPGACSDASCATKLGAFTEDEEFSPYAIYAWHGKLVFVTDHGLRVTDRELTILFDLTESENDSQLAFDGGTVAVTEAHDFALLDLAGCMKLGSMLRLGSVEPPRPCTIAFAEHERSEAIPLRVLPGRALAFNDEGTIGTTVLFGEHGRWDAVTDGEGAVAGDDKLVYTAAVGDDGVNVLAIDRASGHLVWETRLATEPQDTASVGIAVGGGKLAVRVGTKVFALALAD